MKRNVTSWITKKNKVHVRKLTTTSATKATFQESLKSTLLFGQTLALFPVDGLISKNTASMRFVRLSWKCIYSLLSLLGQIFMCLMCFYNMFSSKTSLKSTTPAIFYGTICISMVMFLQISINWPNLVKHIVQMEELDHNFDKNLTFRCNVTCAIVLVLALLEHILSLIYAVAGAMVCYSNTSLYEGFAKFFYPWVFKFLPYSTALGILTQFLHFQSTLIWNFSDLFVISMSYYLTSRLENINKKLQAAQGKYLPEAFWRNTREDYGRATQMVRKVDDVISGIIFVSFANNLFYVCLQLFNTLENGLKNSNECPGSLKKGKSPFGGSETAVYFLFSLVYLITRSVAVSLIASQVNTASMVPSPVLYDVPSPVYCIEVQRFIEQVNGDKVALSGLQFFNVTRGLLLTIAGTIVTYELVMFQFNTSQEPSNQDTLRLNGSVT